MPTSSSPPRSSERLFFGASWALSNGDAGGLAQVVTDLAESCTGEQQEELRQELLALATQCHVDYDGAVERWPALCARAHAVLDSAQLAIAKGTAEMIAQRGAPAQQSAQQPAQQPAQHHDAPFPRPTIIPVMPQARPTPSSEQATQPITPPGRRRRIVVSPRRD